MTQTVTKEIKAYSVGYSGGGKNVTSPYPYRATILLYDHNNDRIAGLYFHKDPTSMPDADYLPDVGVPMSHYPIEDFPRVLDLLRNEEPVYYHQSSTLPTVAVIGTGWEPAGEGES